MYDALTLYYFSPTGGTAKVADIVCGALAKSVTRVDLADKQLTDLGTPRTNLIVIAAPVFVGRIPAFCMDKLSTLQGAGKQAVTLAVYGNRDYDDALLELNDCLQQRGFDVIGSAACIAQHSQVPELAAGRPDETDRQGLIAFAASLLQNPRQLGEVPGNRPYRARVPASTAPYITSIAVSTVPSGSSMSNTAIPRSARDSAPPFSDCTSRRREINACWLPGAPMDA